jgi:predicted molibdopterin-dependent oxidoreductase YjgC
LRTPLLRHNGQLREASWEEALDLIASRLGEIRAANGPGAVGVLGSARGTNEDSYLLAKMARCGLATNNIDFADRLEALPGLFDLPQHRHLTAPGLTLGDLEQADLIVLWQSDPSYEHLAVASRVLRSAERGVPLLEVSARRGQLGNLAQCRLSPRPGTDVYLVYGLLRAVFERRPPSTPVAEALAAGVSDRTAERTEAVTGVPADLVGRAAEMIARADRPLVVGARGVTSSQYSAELLSGLSALSWVGNEGPRPRPVILWLGRCCNLQGAREMGVVPYFVTGYQPVADERTRAVFGRAWGRELPEESGLAAWDMLDQVRAMLIMGDDPVSRLPDAGQARRALQKLDFLAVIDILPTATTEAAHVVLPGASFAEKDGTFTSADRTVQRVRQAVPPPGAARPEWTILCELSTRLGYAMSYDSPAMVLEEIAALTPIYQGLSFAALDAGRGSRLPFAAQIRPPDLDGVDEETESVLHRTLPAPDGEFPLVMAADYSLQAWVDDATVRGTVTLGRELGADRVPASPVIQVSAADAAESRLRDGQRVRLRSRTGEVQAIARVSGDVAPGVVVLPFAMRELVAQVMPSAPHPESGVPILPPCAVSLHRV